MLVFDAGFNRGLTGTSTRWEGFVGFTFLPPSPVVNRVAQRQASVRIPRRGGYFIYFKYRFTMSMSSSAASACSEVGLHFGSMT